MSDPTYDGLCGIPSHFTDNGGRHLRCKFELGHGGDHEWEKHRSQFQLCGGVFHSDMVRWFHPIPKGCICTPLREPDGKIVEWIFKIDCPAHQSAKAAP